MRTLAHRRNTARAAAAPRPAVPWWRAGAVAACLAVVTACGGPSGPVAPQTAPAESSYQLGSGDQVRVTVFGEPNLSGEYRVDGSGVLTLPLVGQVKAAGLSSEQLKRRLEQNFQEFLKTPDVSVEILNYRPFYIVGEVHKPGNYPFVNGITVINAVAIAGGFTYRANTDTFYIQRKGDQRLVAQTATQIRPGDVIIVRERFF